MRRFALALTGAISMVAFALTSNSVQAASTAVPGEGPRSAPPTMVEALASRDVLSSQLTTQLMVTTADRDSLQAQLTVATSKRDELQGQVTDLQAQLATLRQSLSGGRGGVVRTAPMVAVAGNHFSYGYCTWYVANRRPIPWFGDAGQWGPNAAAMGFPEGRTPRPGAVMVTWEGPIGHVAYVESVNADGSWVVSEMNFNAWNVVDFRTVRPGTVPLQTFIYG